MGRNPFALFALLLSFTAAGGPAAKVDPVAEGYPDWQGVSAKSFIMGREITPSDLRHKATVVVDVEPNEKLQSQLLLADGFVDRTGLPNGGFGSNWETFELPRDVIVVVSNRGGKGHEAFMEALKGNGEEGGASPLPSADGMGYSVYDDVTFTGAPDSTGKRPYVYVMGPEGKEPLCQGELDEAMVKTVNEAIAKAKQQINGWETKWRPYYGNIAESKYFPQIAKALEKGKPLGPVEKSIVKDVVAKDPEKAKEAQVLFDALCQTRSDLLLRIQLEVAACPHRAYYDLLTLVRSWPSEKKRLEKVYAKLKTVPEAEKLAKMFMKVKTWAEPDFTCKNAGEAKKIVADLKKMKKDVEKLKASPINAIRGGAALMEVQVDDLISLIPTKVPGK